MTAWVMCYKWEMQEKDERLFFGLEVAAAWPNSLPEGRWIKPEFRHMTLVFLKMADRESLLKNTPVPSWNLSPTGVFEKWIFLPEESPHVAAAVPHFLEGEKTVLEYQKRLSAWLKKPEHFTPHVSVTRDPFDKEAWMKFPCHIPFFIRSAALYKSLGHSNYEILWEKKSLAPFEEIEHTADIAYKIRGENFSQLGLHAVLALSFSYPAFTRYLRKIPPLNSTNDIVSLLNKWIAEIDIREGIGLKAVSYHATIEGKEILEWTMIVDV